MLSLGARRAVSDPVHLGGARLWRRDLALAALAALAAPPAMVLLLPAVLLPAALLAREARLARTPLETEEVIDDFEEGFFAPYTLRRIYGGERQSSVSK